MFGKVILRNKSERKNEWGSSFQNRKSLWEQKSEVCSNEIKVRPHSLSTAQVSFLRNYFLKEVTYILCIIYFSIHLNHLS